MNNIRSREDRGRSLRRRDQGSFGFLPLVHSFFNLHANATTASSFTRPTFPTFLDKSAATGCALAHTARPPADAIQDAS